VYLNFFKGADYVFTPSFKEAIILLKPVVFFRFFRFFYLLKMFFTLFVICASPLENTNNKL